MVKNSAMKNLRLPIQILSIASIAAFAGSMLMLYTTLVPFWKQMAPNNFLAWFSDYSSGITTTTGPFVKLCMLLPLTSILLVWKVPSSRVYWLISYAFILGIMVITFSFFIEANESFTNGTIELALVDEKVRLWGELHGIRTVLGFLSTVFAALGLLKYWSTHRYYVNT